MLGALTWLLVYQLVGEALVQLTGLHGIGTARAFQVSETMGAFAGLAMGLNGLLTAFLFPLLVRIT